MHRAPVLQVLFLDGMRVMNAVRKNERRGQSVTLISSFSALQSELTKARKELRVRHERYLEELRRAEEAKDFELAGLEFQFAPVTEYTDLEEDVLYERCYEANRKDCIAQDRDVAQPNDEILNAVRINYGDQVRNAHIVEFLAQGNRSNQLKMWLEDQVLNLEKLGQKHKASIFRDLLDSSGGAVVEDVK